MVSMCYWTTSQIIGKMMVTLGIPITGNPKACPVNMLSMYSFDLIQIRIHESLSSLMERQTSLMYQLPTETQLRVKMASVQ